MTEKAAHDEVGGVLKCLWEDITAKFGKLEELPRAQFDVVSKVGWFPFHPPMTHGNLIGGEKHLDCWPCSGDENALKANFNVQPIVIDQYRCHIHEVRASSGSTLPWLTHKTESQKEGDD